MVRLAVIADDLTGANDTAVQFAKRNISACVQINFDEEKILQEKSDVVVVDTDSRDDSATDAYQKVKRVSSIFKNSGAKQVYKKVDSTLRGNLGAEIAAAAEVFCPDIVVIAPAFPNNQRTTVGGYHFLNGVPIELTEIAHAPKTPVHESQIIKLLQTQTEHKIAEIPLAVICRGRAAIADAVRDKVNAGEFWLVFDVAKETHFDEIIQAVKSYKKVLWVGSAGLADHLPAFWEWSTQQKTIPALFDGPAFIVAGSVSHITQGQIKELLSNTQTALIKLDIEKFLNDGDQELLRCVREATACVLEKRDVLLASALTDEDVEAAVKAGKKKGLDDKEVSELTARAMAAITEKIELTKVAGLVLTGGDTAVHVCRALRADSIEVLDEVAVGIPLGRLNGGSCDGINVVTKAGAFGDKESFLQAVRAIKNLTGSKAEYRRTV